MKLEFLKKLLEKLKKISSKGINIEEITPNELDVEPKVPFDKNSKMSIKKEGNVIYIEIFEKIGDKDIFNFEEEWDTGLINYGDRHDTFSRIIIADGLIKYEFTLYPYDEIELRKREQTVEDEIYGNNPSDCIYDTALRFNSNSLEYREFLHDHMKSTSIPCQFKISPDSYHGIGTIIKNTYIPQMGKIPENFYDFNKVNSFLEEFRNLDNEIIKSHLEGFIGENNDVKTLVKKIQS